MAGVKMTVDTQEARLLAVYRSIREYNDSNEANPKSDVMDKSEAGQILGGLEEAFDLAKLEADDSFSLAQMKALIKGFVGGVVASRISALAAEGIDLYSDEQIEEQEEDFPEDLKAETISGGPTGGVVAGQLTGDPSFVKQTGPQKADS